MTKERYLRDLLNVKAAGFNLVRVHVHTEQEVFYDLCDELGIAVFQDSSTTGRILQQMNGRRDLQMFTEKM